MWFFVYFNTRIVKGKKNIDIKIKLTNVSTMSGNLTLVKTGILNHCIIDHVPAEYFNLTWK